MRTINEIIVHCSYTKPNMDVGADWIRNIHVNEKGFADIGYHFIIRRDGSYERGRRIERIGAHCKGHNRNTIGICMIGGMSYDNKPDNNFTTKQFKELKQTIYFLKEFFPDIKKVSGHRDYANKDCPCFDVHELIKEDKDE
jgi:N-acetylmuramoyl-L-alanine amidase